jgi:uncharacterized membrane protein YcfT
MAKGLSIFLVVAMYCASSVGEDTGLTGILHWTLAFAMPFRMPEFFLISGLFLSRVITRPWRTFADRRVVHYLYFYALWAIIHIVFKVALLAGDPATAASYLAWAIIEPYGVLWFIYMLALFGLVTKLLNDARAPHWGVLALAAVLQVASIHTGSYAVDQFAEYYIHFYAGYLFAPQLFRLIGWALDHVLLALLGLIGWAVVNAGLVFSPGFRMDPVHIQMGCASLPGVHLVLAVLGTLALCVGAALLTQVPFMGWLRWLGSKSLIVYVAFVLPMGLTRTILLKLGIEEVNVLSLLTMGVAITTPLVLWWLTERLRFGRWLFDRPTWAHLPGSPRRSAEPVPSPAE